MVHDDARLTGVHQSIDIWHVHEFHCFDHVHLNRTGPPVADTGTSKMGDPVPKVKVVCTWA